MYFQGNQAVDGATTQSSTSGNWFSERPLMAIEVSSSCIRDAPQLSVRLTHGGGWICIIFTELVKWLSLTEKTVVQNE